MTRRIPRPPACLADISMRRKTGLTRSAAANERFNGEKRPDSIFSKMKKIFPNLKVFGQIFKTLNLTLKSMKLRGNRWTLDLRPPNTSHNTRFRFIFVIHAFALYRYLFRSLTSCEFITLLALLIITIFFSATVRIVYDKGRGICINRCAPMLSFYPLCVM